MIKVFHFNTNEAKHFISVVNKDTFKDNMMFFQDTNGKEEVFLMLHGTTTGYVQYNNQFLTLKELYQQLKKENTFYLLTQVLGYKCIHIICCHGYFINSYTEEGITLQPFFNNKGYVEAKLDTSTNVCIFKEVA